MTSALSLIPLHPPLSPPLPPSPSRSVVSTKHGNVNTDHILFICSGAFTACKPSDMLAELQGRLPIRVELRGLTEQVGGGEGRGEGGGVREGGRMNSSGKLQSSTSLACFSHVLAHPSAHSPAHRPGTLQDLFRILTEPEANMIRQQHMLMATEGVDLEFTDAAIREIATMAAEVSSMHCRMSGVDALVR